MIKIPCGKEDRAGSREIFTPYKSKQLSIFNKYVICAILNLSEPTKCARVIDWLTLIGLIGMYSVEMLIIWDNSRWQKNPKGVWTCVIIAPSFCLTKLFTKQYSPLSCSSIFALSILSCVFLFLQQYYLCFVLLNIECWTLTLNSFERVVHRGCQIWMDR